MSFKKTTHTIFDVPVKVAIKTFANSDLTTDSLVITHPYNTKVVEAIIYKPNGDQMLLANIFNIANSTYNSVRFDFGGALEAGNHLLILKFYAL